MTSEDTAPRARNPLVFLTAVLVANCALLGWFGWHSWSFFRDARAAESRSLRIQELGGAIAHLDEVLTMSARMAAATGDPAWEDRYHSFETELDSAIKEAVGLAPAEHSRQAAMDIDAANLKLVEMESDAFGLVREGQLAEAQARLHSEEYEALKEAYAAALARCLADPEHHHLRLAELRGTIVHLDEVLTMSARMAAVTGDSQWEERYSRFEPQLDAAIKEAIEWADEGQANPPAAETDAANLKLVAVEAEAFEHVRQGRLDEAQALLFSDGYAAQKKIYSDGMVAFGQDLSNVADRALAAKRRPVFLYVGLVILLIPFTAVSWLAVYRVTHRWEATLMENQRALQRQGAELVELTESLDRQVAERTAELRRMATVFMDAADPILIEDLDEIVVDMNKEAERSYGWSRDELLGQSIETIIPPERPEQGEELRAQLRTGGAVRNVEALRWNRDGTRIPVLLTLSLLTDEDGEVVGVATLGKDITALKRTEAELEAAVKDTESLNLQLEQRAEEARIMAAEAEAATVAKSQFLATMSHEIRTPLNAVIGMTDLALDTELTEEQRDYLETVHSSGDALLSVINDVLDLSKMEAGQLSMDSIDFGLRGAIETVLSALALRAQERGVELMGHVGPDVPDALRGDPGRLRQVVTNLVGNAVKFTEQGEIVLRVAAQSEAADEVELEISVSDTGIGIPEDMLDSIFGAFIQADGSTTRAHGGTGLGLAISERIVEQMGGRISVRSEVGKGSTFSFTARFGVAEHPPVVEDVPDADLAGMKVLVVDDNATNRTILTECLSSWGLSVREAPGGAEALRELEDHHQRGHPFALLLLDRAMPDVDGFAVAERIQSAAHLVRTTVVMLTSAGARGDAARCKELGIDAYLLKPVRQSELRDAIVSALARGPRDDAEGRAPVTRYTIREARRKLRVLLAEDNVVNQRLAMRLLEKAGHVVTVVGDGRAAIEATESGAFDVVLMDVQMPEVDGVEATGAIREREKQTGRHTPIIALTAHAMAEDERRCLEAGMDAYVTKPIRADVLFEAIGKVIGE